MVPTHRSGPVRSSRPDGRRARQRVTVALLGLLLGAGACELAEVTTPPGEDVLVVESVLHAGSDRQVVLLHRSLDGGLVRGERGARVTLAGPGGESAAFLPAPLASCADRVTAQSTDSLVVQASCYVLPPRSPVAVRPGTTYELRVETTDGRVVRARTTVPGAYELRAPRLGGLGRQAACSLPPRTNLPLVWSVSSGAWSYLADLEIIGLRSALGDAGFPVPERLQLTGLAISESDTTLLLPAEFGLFEAGDIAADLLRYLQQGFPAGVSVHLTLAAVDRNYVNSVRGGSFNPSGNVRISSVVGDGVGVFGSLVPQQLRVVVGADDALPSCLP